MKKVNVQYTVLNESLEEVPHHFETNGEMVKVMNKSDSVLGSLNDFMFAGKVVESGSFKDLKVSGNYRVRGLSGLPSGFAVDKTGILSIEAVGEIGSPSIIKYELTTQSGEITSCVYADGKYSEWSSGGLTVENEIKGIKSEIGKRSELNTKVKSDLVSAINELSKGILLTQSNGADVSEQVTNLSNHTHDDRYLKINGGDIKGTIVLGRSANLKYANAYGREVDAIRSEGGQLIIGNSSDITNIESSSSKLMFNGRSIVTSENIGEIIKGTPELNLSGDKYLQTRGGKMYGDMQIIGGNDIVLDGSSDGTAGKLRWRSSGGTSHGEMYVDDSGRFNLFSKGEKIITIRNDGTITTRGKMVYNAINGESGFTIQLDGSDAGMGMYRNTSAKQLGFYDWNRRQRMAYFSERDGSFHMDVAPYIQDTRVWLQPNQPTGNHKTGDIWIGYGG